MKSASQKCAFRFRILYLIAAIRLPPAPRPRVGIPIGPVLFAMPKKRQYAFFFDNHEIASMTQTSFVRPGDADSNVLQNPLRASCQTTSGKLKLDEWLYRCPTRA